MKNVYLSLIALSFCSVYAAQNVSLEAVSIEGDQEIAVSSLSDSTTKITTEDIKTPSTTLNEALKNQFFISYKKSGDYNSEPYMRGRGTTGVAVYLEGLRLNVAHSDSINLFNTIDAQEIDVYRGASGAALGVGAMSGGVVVKYKEPQFSTSSELQNTNFFNAKFSMFSNSGYTTTLGTTLYNNYFNLSLSGGLSDYNNYTDGNNNEVLHSQNDASHYNIATAIKTGDDSYIYARYMKDKSSAQDPFSRYQNAGVWFFRDRPKDEAKTYFIGFRKRVVWHL